ncbi:aspartate carbamoyltransferase, partial [bacterium]|nr:aspartate carbamoyltransferase [bacterium]
MEKIKKNKKDFLTLKDYSKEEIIYLLELTQDIKKNKDNYLEILKNKNLALLFDKPSTRTRVSFETAAKIMSADVSSIAASTSAVVKGESLKDTIL